jgi:hypothetical protein
MSKKEAVLKEQTLSEESIERKVNPKVDIVFKKLFGRS